MFVYKNNEQLKIEIKKIFIETGHTQKEIADKLEIKPRQITNILNKENLAFRDLKRILDAMGCDLIIDIVPKQK